MMWGGELLVFILHTKRWVLCEFCFFSFCFMRKKNHSNHVCRALQQLPHHFIPNLPVYLPPTSYFRYSPRQSHNPRLSMNAPSSTTATQNSISFSPDRAPSISQIGSDRPTYTALRSPKTILQNLNTHNSQTPENHRKGQVGYEGKGKRCPVPNPARQSQPRSASQSGNFHTSR